MTAQDIAEHTTRHALNVRVRYRRVAERTYRPEGGWTWDLNLRGAWVGLPEPVPPGTTLALALDTPAGDLPLLAHVAWTAPGLRDAPYLHGVRFPGLTPDHRHRLHALVTSETRRVPIRLACVLAATCHRTDDGCPAVPGTVRDLAETGAGVRLPEHMAPGTAVRLSTATPYGRIVAETQVVWADPPGRLPRGASYRHGLRFLRLDRSSALPLQVLLEGHQ